MTHKRRTLLLATRPERLSRRQQSAVSFLIKQGRGLPAIHSSKRAQLLQFRCDGRTLPASGHGEQQHE
jgi:hypothetical protein